MPGSQPHPFTHLLPILSYYPTLAGCPLSVGISGWAPVAALGRDAAGVSFGPSLPLWRAHAGQQCLKLWWYTCALAISRLRKHHISPATNHRTWCEGWWPPGRCLSPSSVRSLPDGAVCTGGICKCRQDISSVPKPCRSSMPWHT